MKQKTINLFKIKKSEIENIHINDSNLDKDKDKNTKPETFWNKWGNIIMIGIFVIVIPVVFIYLLKHPNIRTYIKNYILYIRNNNSISNYSLFIICFILFGLLFSNLTIPNLISGLVFGIYKGSLIASVSVLLTASISFFISKKLIKNKIEKTIKNNNFLRKYYNNIVKSEHTFSNLDFIKFVFLTRLTPIAPFQLFSYFWGISKIKYWVYIIGTLGVLPSVIFEIYIGSQFKNIDEIFENKSKLLHIVIIIAISIFIGWITEKLINRALKKKTKENKNINK